MADKRIGLAATGGIRYGRPMPGQVRFPHRRVVGLIASCLLALALLPLGARGADVYSDDQKGWALGTCAVLTQVNKRSHSLLGGRLANEKTVAATKKTLEGAWGVSSRDDLLRVLTWLDQHGHRQEFEAIAALTPEQLDAVKNLHKDSAESADRIAFVRETAPALGARSLIGWDFSRYVSLCGWGVLVGYLSEDEAWARIMPAARKLQQTFTSWHELGQNYLVGRRFWSLASTDKNGSDYANAIQWLETSPESPWKKYPWDLNLDAKSGNSAGPPTQEVLSPPRL